MNDADYDAANAKLKAQAKQIKIAREFIESLTSALGPYPYINGTGLVADAYHALSALLRVETSQQIMMDAVRKDIQKSLKEIR